MTNAGPLSVGVLVDLFRHADAGGHVKCWERFAAAAGAFPDRLDLTIYCLGRDEQVEALAPNVRFHALPPCWGTDRFSFLRSAAGDTDLAPFHGALAGHLARHEILQATHAFAFSLTAARVAKRRRIPLVVAVQTDLAAFAPIYTREIIRRGFGRGALSRFLLERLAIPARVAGHFRARLERLVTRADHVMVSNAVDCARLRAVHPSVSLFGRGIDHRRFHPAKRDRAALKGLLGVPDRVPLLLFAGRVDASKGADFVGKVIRDLIGSGRDVHLLVAGDGALKGCLQAALGRHATCPGVLAPESLALAMASADLFLFPSESETFGNVVLEAKASGLPVLVSSRLATAETLVDDGVDGLVLHEGEPRAWGRAVAALLDQPARRQAMAAAARADIERNRPDWQGVLARDLLPVWSRLARRNRP